MLDAFGQPGAFRRFGAGLVLKHAGAEGVTAVVEALTDVLRDVRQRALAALIRLGPAATPIFASIAADKGSTLRVVAIDGLPQTGGPTVEEVLQGLLQDDDTRVRRAADGALKELGQRAMAERLRQERAERDSHLSGRDELLSASASVIRETVVLGHHDGWDAPAPILHSPVSEAERVARANATSAAPTLADACYFSVTAPLRAQAASWFIVELWCHEDSPDAFVRQQSRQFGWQPIRSVGPVDVERGTTMEVELQLPGFDVQEDRGVLRWQGNVGVIGFAAKSSAGTLPGTHLGSARVSISGVPVARVYFQIDLGVGERQSADCTATVKTIESAFASYSSEDRNEVLGRIQGMQKILPKLDVFMDVVSLRSGDLWRQRLVAEIACRDAFFLFWSRSASASRWVDFEWRTALKERGPEFIDPVPLESPEIAPPPEELSDRHFGDWSLRMRTQSP
jgi:hypothetical protein